MSFAHLNNISSNILLEESMRIILGNVKQIWKSYISGVHKGKCKGVGRSTLTHAAKPLNSVQQCCAPAVRLKSFHAKRQDKGQRLFGLRLRS